MAHRTVGVKELKARLSDYIRQVKSGTAVVITERGKPVGRIVPEPAAVDRQARLRELASAGRVAWSGNPLRPRRALSRVRGKRTVADLLLENRE